MNGGVIASINTKRAIVAANCFFEWFDCPNVGKDQYAIEYATGIVEIGEFRDDGTYIASRFGTTLNDRELRESIARLPDRAEVPRPFVVQNHHIRIGYSLPPREATSW